MYIWILLATIMVALSFFNVSPRNDKENVFSDIKAATVVSRFRIEHLAALHTVECELIRRGRNYVNITELKDGKFGNTPVSFEENLPVGYVGTDNPFEMVHHWAFCYRKDIIRHPDAVLSSSCSSQNKYIVSYAIIPDRWLAKTTSDITMGDGVTYTIKKPLPAFINFMSRDLAKMRNTGWAICTGNDCNLIGRTATQFDYNNETEQVILKKFEIPQAVKEKLKPVCSDTPCLFAIDKVKNVNTHCL